MAACEPRRFGTSSSFPGAGLPHDRMSRLAARRAFVDLKHVFSAAVATLPGRHGDWLRAQVRAAEEPMDLWLLRAPVMQALSARDDATRRWRQQLRKSIGTLFPDSGGMAEVGTGFGAFAHS
jgi:hypothetical protein